MTEYDPSAHNVTEVQAHLAKADPDEFQRVKAAEQAGQGRKGILEYVQPEDARVKPSEDGYTRRVVSD